MALVLRLLLLALIGVRACRVSLRRCLRDDHLSSIRSRRRHCQPVMLSHRQHQRLPCTPQRHHAPAMISVEDAESNARIVEALFGGAEEAVDQIAAKDPEIASHLQLDYDEEGQPTQLRFVYVDESECIGCTYCADVARNTFVMEEGAGRARAFAQGQDDPEVVMEAIDCCPVNCISFVDHEDLVILETEREGETINPASIGIPATWSVSMNRPASKAKLKSSGSMVCCNNWCV